MESPNLKPEDKPTPESPNPTEFIKQFAQQMDDSEYPEVTEEMRSSFETLKAKINKEILEYQLKLQDGTYSMTPSQITPEQKKHQDIITAILNNLKAVRNGEDISEILTEIDSIITTYTNPDGSIDSIELSLEKNLERFTNFYTQHNIDTPPDFNQTITEIWNKNADKIKQAIEEEGFDDVLFIPPYDTVDINEKTTNEYAETSQYRNIKNAGGIQAITDTKPNQPRIVLIHRKNAENLQRPEISQTKDKSIYDLCNATTDQEQQHINELIQNKQPLPIDGLTLGEYLIADRLHFQETGNHLDNTNSWTWLPASYSGSRVVGSYWRPDDSRVGVSANGPGFSCSGLNARSSRTFSL
jgi:hypothetical protein